MQNEIPLKLKNIVKNYSSVHAVKDVSFELEKGEVFGLLGPNGAGKTSLISCVTTLEVPTSGSVEVFGIDNQKNPLAAKKLIGIVHQEVINSGFFNIEEIVSFQRGYYGLAPAPEKVQSILEKLSLWEHRKKQVKQLSGGMKRRLMIAKALVTEPKVLLLDEPTAGVDITLRENLFKLVRELKASGMTILLTTHYLEEAELLCDRVGIIRLGKLEIIGKTQEVIRQFSQKKIKLRLKKTPSEILRKPTSFLKDEYSYDVAAEFSLGQLLAEIQVSGEDLLDVDIQNGKLEEAFLRVLGQNQ